MGVIYKSYHLKDHLKEDIQCIFYDAIEFMSDARSKGGKVFVHCVQGMSRSATICCAYMIFTQRISYEAAYQRVKERRACVNPNMTFITQLRLFHKRLYDPSFGAISMSPRVFALMSHQREDPWRIIGKL